MYKVTIIDEDQQKTYEFETRREALFSYRYHKLNKTIKVMIDMGEDNVPHELYRVFTKNFNCTDLLSTKVEYCGYDKLEAFRIFHLNNFYDFKALSSYHQTNLETINTED